MMMMSLRKKCSSSIPPFKKAYDFSYRSAPQHCVMILASGEHIQGFGQGACIGFEDGLFKGSVSKLECLYDFEDKKQAIMESSYLKANDQELASIIDNHSGGKVKALRDFIGSITDSLVRFKNQSFSPEKETRWAFHATCIDDARFKIKFRPHRLGLTLYQEAEIDLNKIKRITLGPQVASQNIKTFQDFMKASNCPAKIDISKVSLR